MSDQAAPDPSPIGLVGCGTVGRTLFGRLRAAGHAVVVHDRDPSTLSDLVKLGARRAATPRELGAWTRWIVSALPDADALEAAVRSGLWEEVAPKSVHIETSTVGPDCVRRLGAEARARKIRLLDAPISRGPADATRASLTMWVGGHADYFDLARPVLRVLADQVVYCGGLGNGQVTKLVNNLIAHALTVMVCEALALGVRAGVDLDILRSSLESGTAQNRMLDELLPGSVFRGEWEPGLRLDLAIKDLRLAAGLAQEHGVRLSTIGAVEELYRQASSRGWGDLSAHAVVRLVEEASSVELRSALLAGDDE